MSDVLSSGNWDRTQDPETIDHPHFSPSFYFYLTSPAPLRRRQRGQIKIKKQNLVGDNFYRKLADV